MQYRAETFRKHRYPDQLAAALLLIAFSLPGMAADTANSSAGIHIDAPHQYADVFLDKDRFSGSFNLNIQAEDVGKTADLFLVARLDDRWYMKTGDDWLPWDLTAEALTPVTTRVLGETEELAVLEGERLPAGDYQVFAAYRPRGGNLVIIRDKLVFRVNAARADTLQRFSSNETMSAYIKDGMRAGVNTGTGPIAYIATDLVPAPAPSPSAEDSAAGTLTARVSTTNLQEVGVDEADSVKTDGDNLYMLRNCDFQPCLDVYALDGAGASAALEAEYTLGNTVGPDGMYLVKDRPGSDLLVTVGGQNQFVAWRDIWGWMGNTTEIEFFNADQPQDLTSVEKLSIDGVLVSSRRVGDTLYVVTRYTPYIDRFQPYPLDDTAAEENEKVLEETSLEDLVPKVVDSGETARDLISAKECYLPISAVDKNNNPSIITITGIPLSDPTAFNSVCFLGGSETLYMTPDSLYLATTQWDYRILASDALIYNPNHTTAVHKFALGEGGIEYRGSGQVKGHLGWSDDKKSFRMGENGGYLNIVTSIGDTWNETSSTRLTVLKESDFSDELETVSVVDGIGKPGEQLYAARFIGNRAYLVTFRVTDPMYVMDLSNEEAPVIAGELEIDGYSDYLHPVTENLLLGIGKDAVADDSSSDFRGIRGAWYQGVKLSLFDVADPANPVEVNSVVLGKRGTESEVLWDHHALSFIPASGAEPARLAIPVQLHDTTPSWEGFDASDPSAWYDYTHTALYSFEISALGISQAGRLIGDTGKGDSFIIPLGEDGFSSSPPEDNSGGADADSGTGEVEAGQPVDLPTRLIAPIFNSYGDRSVLLDDAVFYIHDGKVLTSVWGEDRDASD